MNQDVSARRAMFEEFDWRIRARIVRSADGVVRILSYPDHYIEAEARTPRTAARDYLSNYGHIFGVQPRHLRNLFEAPQRIPTAAGHEFRYVAAKSQFDLTTVAFQQTYFGLPVWEAGLSVTIKHAPLRIVGARSTSHPEPKLSRPAKLYIAREGKLDAKTLAQHLGLPESAGGPLRINGHRLMIYRHDAERLRHAVPQPRRRRSGFHATAPTLPLPPIHGSIREGAHYVVSAVYFSFDVPPVRPLHWVALIEIETGSVLLIRPLVENVTGLIFPTDPATLGGPPAKASNAALNRWRSAASLPGLAAPRRGIQTLRGNRVRIADVLVPTIAPPKRPIGKSFSFAARTDNFAAVNAYYNCNRVFELVEALGFSVSDYFCNTKFPTRVDHRGHFSKATPLGVEINAHCAGVAKGDRVGIGYTTFSLADLENLEQPIGIACDFRIVLHELLGHGVLYNHIGAALFKFAHSAGDSFAAILHDPGSEARDRYATFPWLTGVAKNQQRRHNRTAARGWGWDGAKARNPFDEILDWKGYNNEQILSSTMFRLYRAIGGDAKNIAERQFAAHMTCRILLAAIQTFTAATSPENAAHFAAALMKADAADWPAQGLSGGAYHKVIRWAFEKQGLYQRQRSKRPNDKKGAPPPVDVYIEDGRRGEYDYRSDYALCRAIWNRRKADRGRAHEQPVAGVVNYAFVKIKNRGFMPAADVVVRAFHCRASAQSVYPRDWLPMQTVSLRVATVPPNSSREIVVGPFAWVPTAARESMLMIASAAGDASNVDTFAARDSIANARLVPHDNNIAQRDVIVAKQNRRSPAHKI
jgi:hypothetical protein